MSLAVAAADIGGCFERRVHPEILDGLPSSHPDARHSRRDLKLINAVMGNARWLRRKILSRGPREGGWVEIGAGTGEFGAALHAQGMASVMGLDLQPRPENWPLSWEWHQGSALDFKEWGSYPRVCANLVLHHFTDAHLIELGERLNRHARVILACEPARRSIWLRLFPILCSVIQANRVTRHDGVVSIRAGFRGDELATLLGLDAKIWTWQTEETAFGAYRFIAQKRA